MKKLIILFSVFFTINAMQAQNIVQNNKEWSVLSYQDPIQYVRTEIYWFAGDTSINNISYKKLLYSTKITKEEPELRGFLREYDHKVYGKAISQVDGTLSEEGLLYDFDVEVGDTIKIQNYFKNGENADEMPHLIVDSISIIGSNEKQFFFKNIEEIWISEIGSLEGLISVGYTIPSSWRSKLLCCKDSSGNLLYKSPDYNTCFYSAIESGQEVQSQITISPNPITDYIRVEVNNIKQEKYTFKLYNSQGNLVLQKGIAAKTTEIYAKELPQGIYFYSVSNKEQTIFERGKVVKVK